MTEPKRYKLCRGCGTSKSVNEFYRRKTGYLEAKCKPCNIADVARRKSAKRAAARAARLALPQPPPPTAKQCIRCGQVKPIENFRERENGLRRGECKDCRSAYGAAWYANPANRARVSVTGKAYAERNPEKLWAKRMLKYGLTPEQYNDLYEAQQGRCPICGEARDRAGGSDVGGGNVLCVDHDHETGAVRGLLCSGCNRGIGLLGDDPNRLRAAIDYLQAGGPHGRIP